MNKMQRKSGGGQIALFSVSASPADSFLMDES